MKRVIELGAGLVFTGKANPSVVPYYPQKTEISGEEERYFHRSYPEKVGVSSGRILAMLEALEREKRANIHNLLLLKDGELICDCSHPGYSVNTWHLSHSMSKTVTGMAIGMLVDEGSLDTDTRLVDIFPHAYYHDERIADITVKHLLTMTTGVRFSEAGSVSESRWTDAFFESSLAFNPGEQFSYNSMNSYILAKIVCKVSGLGLMDFLKPRLFEPLHIDNVFWELGPEGIEKGGWGLFMSVESWAKLGLMMLEGGSFEGKRILSESWVKESTTGHAKTPDSLGHYDYGYQLWVSRDGEGFLFNGMLGQNVWVYPKNNIVLALNSGNNELFQNSPAMEVVEKYLALDLADDLTESCFGGDLVDLRRKEAHFFESRHWIRPYQQKKGISFRLGFRPKPHYPEEWDNILGRYHFSKNNLGILPLFVRAMQNNLKNSIDGVAFEREGDSIFFIFSEGGVNYKLEVGFYDFKETVLDYHGEKYILKVIGEAMEDEDREMLYKLEILMPEMPNTRKLKFSFDIDGRLVMRMSEMPNEKIADAFLRDMTVNNQRLAFFYGIVEKRVGKNFAKNKLIETFAPTLIGARIGDPNYISVMDEEREKLKAGEKTAKLINTVITKFLHDEDDIPEEEISQSGIRSFIGDIVERIKSKIPTKKP